MRLIVIRKDKGSIVDVVGEEQRAKEARNTG